MQTVFNNDMVAHVWAQQNQESGRSSNGNFYFEGPTIYSYGAHFPIATFSKGHVLVTEQDYSVSTGKHISLVWRAIGSTPKIYIPNWGRGFYGANLNLSKQDHKNNWQWFKDQVQECLEKASRARSNTRWYLRDADRYCEKMEGYKKFFKLSWKVPSIDVDLEKLKADLKKQAKIKTKKNAAKNKKRIADWKRGEWVSLHDITTIYLRIEGDKVKTSHGSEFPKDHAIRAFRLIALCKKEGGSWQRNGETIRLGHFQIDKIDSSGNVTAGCHYVKWNEIKECAELLGIE